MRVETAEKLNKVSDSYWNFIKRQRKRNDRTYFMTLKEVAEKLGVTTERVRQIELRAILKLRHPKRSELLKPFL